MDIYCRNGKCLICGSKLSTFYPHYFNATCKNGCYEYEFMWTYNVVKNKEYDIVEFKVFNESYQITTLLNRKEKKKLKKKMIDKIKFYKENYRYLAEILEKG